MGYGQGRCSAANHLRLVLDSRLSAEARRTYCNRCEKATENPVARYILGGLVFEDHSGHAWSSAVGNDSGVKLLHAEAEEMKRLLSPIPRLSGARFMRRC